MIEAAEVAETAVTPVFAPSAAPRNLVKEAVDLVEVETAEKVRENVDYKFILFYVLY
jgi:hypothetical protein